MLAVAFKKAFKKFFFFLKAEKKNGLRFPRNIFYFTLRLFQIIRNQHQIINSTLEYNKIKYTPWKST